MHIWLAWISGRAYCIAVDVNNAHYLDLCSHCIGRWLLPVHIEQQWCRYFGVTMCTLSTDMYIVCNSVHNTRAHVSVVRVLTEDKYKHTILQYIEPYFYCHYVLTTFQAKTTIKVHFMNIINTYAYMLGNVRRLPAYGHNGITVLYTTFI